MSIQELLKLNGFWLERNKNHLVYKNSLGLTFVMTKTASDHRAELNQIKMLERLYERAGLTIITERKREPMQQDTFNPPKMILPSPGSIVGVEPVKSDMAKIVAHKYFDKEAEGIILAGRENKKSYKEIAQVLVALGYVNKRGKPISNQDCMNFMYYKRVSHRPQKDNTAPKAHIAGASFIDDITEVISSNLSNEMKERMILTLVESRGR